MIYEVFATKKLKDLNGKEIIAEVQEKISCEEMEIKDGVAIFYFFKPFSLTKSIKCVVKNYDCINFFDYEEKEKKEIEHKKMCVGGV